MTRLRPRTARTAFAGLAVAAALALTGCSATNPIQTQLDYPPSDGTAATVGDLRVLNLIVIAQEEGGPGTLTGALANGAADDEDVTLLVGGEQAVDVTVPGRSTVLIGVTGTHPRYEAIDVRVTAVDTAPGGTTAVSVSTGSGGTVEIPVPVLDATLPEYADLVPTAEPTPTPTDEAGTQGTDDAAATDEGTEGAEG